MMTPVVTKEVLKGLGAPDLVYIREIRAGDVIEQIVGEVDVAIDPNSTLYAVHGADGERLAVMIDRETAVAAAMAHELEPVSVH